MNLKDCIYSGNDFEMNYKVFYPDNYENLPLMIYLHGAGERGEDSSHLYRHGIPKLINEGMEINAVVLCPQCPRQFVWDNVVYETKKIIDLVVKEFGIKNDRICLTGSSMGGFGTWMMAKTYPEFFSGIAPVAGGGMSWRASKLKTTPVLAFHGTNDVVVPLIYSKLMVDGAVAGGAQAELVVLEEFGHNDGIDYAYRSTNLVEWLLACRRTNFDHVPEFCESIF